MSVADGGGGEPRYYGEIANRPGAVAGWVKKFSEPGQRLSFCYEAGPCGYGLYRQLTDLGHRCDVVAPSLIPTKPGERVKTDRRDANKLSRLHRAGELTPVWVPGPEQEAVRDLTRAREDLKSLERRAKQRLGALLLRHGKRYRAGQKKWTQRYFAWLEQVKFDSEVQQIVFQEYVDTVTHLQGRVQALEVEMERALSGWSLAPVVEALMALRGVQLVSAMTLMAELGDITRFDSPRQLMGYLGLVPSEHSSGRRQRRGAITKAGNAHARRTLVESAWSYRFPARQDRPSTAARPPDQRAGPGDRLDRAEALVRALPPLERTRQAPCPGLRGRGARVGGVHLGDCVRSQGPPRGGALNITPIEHTDQSLTETEVANIGLRASAA